MKKIFVLFITMSCFFATSAQTYVWNNGKIELVTNSCDIRFNKIPAENFGSLASIVEMNNSLYWLMGADKSYRNRLACGYQGYNTDIEYNRRSSNGEGADIYNLSTGTGNLSSSNGRDPWSYFAKFVYNASMIIDGIGQYCDTTNTAFAYCLGEALFLRAFALSEMVKLWGDVPTSWKFFGGAVLPTQPKQDRNLIYESIRSDLKRAANLLPWSSQIPNYDRSSALYREPTSSVSSPEIYMEHPNSYCNYTGAPSKAAALGLLARIDLNYAGYAMKPNNLGVPGDGFCIQLNLVDQEKRRALYQEALNVCAQIINHEGSFKLQANFEDVFKKVCADVTDYSNSEVIWEIPFADGVRGQVMNYNSPKMSDALMGLKNNNSGSSQGDAQVVPTLYFDYEAGDTRRDVTIAPYRWYYDNGRSYSSDPDKVQLAFPEVVYGEKFLYQKLQSIDSWYFAKYRVEWMSRNRMGNDDGVNFPILRYADVLLMFCEASLGGITGDIPQNTTSLDAQSLFNSIRTRAGLSSKTLTMQNLMDERKFEFAGEAIRKYDLIRWGKLRSAMEGARARLDNLDAHTGEFTNTTDSIYYKYRYIGDELSYDYGIKGYIIESISHTRPADYDTSNGWTKKSVFESGENERYLDRSRYILYVYDHPEYLDNHQLWPIFDVDLQRSNGLLWNDYNY